MIIVWICCLTAAVFMGLSVTQFRSQPVSDNKYLHL